MNRSVGATGDVDLPFTTEATVTSAELVRQFGRWQDQAASHPVVVTHHGRARILLVSVAQYEELLSTKEQGGRAAEVRSAGTDAVNDLMDHIEDGFIAFDADMTVRAINRAACGFLKAERERVLGRKLNERLPGIEETFGYASLARAATSGSSATFEMPSFAYEGRWLLFQTFPYNGGAACLFRDITADHDARRQVDAESATFAASSAHGKIGRAKLTARGTFSYINGVFAGFAGFAPEGLAHARLNDIIVPRQRAAASAAIEAVLDGGAPRHIDVALLTKNGSERSIRIGLAALRSQGAPNGAVAVATEQTPD